MKRISAALVAVLGCEANPAFDLDTGTASGPINPDDAAVAVGNLRATWGTPNTIRWDWEAQGDPDRLLAYELVVGTSEDDVLSGGGSTVVWTEEQNPELGRFLLPRTGGEDPVVFTATDALEPDTRYYAQLIARDTAGNATVSNIAAGRTSQPPVDEIVIIADENTAGFSIPGTFALSSERPFAGTQGYRYESVCEGQAECWENLRRQEILLDVGAISQGSFGTTAYFEVALAIESETTPWWCSFWLWYDGSSADRLASYDAWTGRTGGDYRVIQVPLRAFLIQGEPTPYDELSFGLYGFNVGGPWSDGAVVYVDELRLRW